MTGRRRVVRGAVLAALLAGGCASLLRPPRAGPEPAGSGDSAADERYQKVLDRWTRRAELFDKLDPRVFLAATLSTMAMREARAARVAGFRSLPAAQAEALLAAERKAHGEELEVMLGLHANEHRFDDLARPTSIWSIALVGEAGEVAPTSIDRLVRPDANTMALYPYLEAFWTGYRLHFPRAMASGAPLLPPGTKKVALRLSSAVGKVEIPFELEAQAGGADWP